MMVGAGAGVGESEGRCEMRIRPDGLPAVRRLILMHRVGQVEKKPINCPGICAGVVK